MLSGTLAGIYQEIQIWECIGSFQEVQRKNQGCKFTSQNPIPIHLKRRDFERKIVILNEIGNFEQKIKGFERKIETFNKKIDTFERKTGVFERRIETF